MAPGHCATRFFIVPLKLHLAAARLRPLSLYNKVRLNAGLERYLASDDLTGVQLPNPIPACVVWLEFGAHRRKDELVGLLSGVGARVRSPYALATNGPQDVRLAACTRHAVAWAGARRWRTQAQRGIGNRAKKILDPRSRSGIEHERRWRQLVKPRSPEAVFLGHPRVRVACAVEAKIRALHAQADAAFHRHAPPPVDPQLHR